MSDPEVWFNLQYTCKKYKDFLSNKFDLHNKWRIIYLRKNNWNIKVQSNNTSDCQWFFNNYSSKRNRQWYEHNIKQRSGYYLIFNRKNQNIFPITIWNKTIKKWYRDGKLHRDGGPAIILKNGTEMEDFTEIVVPL